jgi:hypothetical protein
MNQPRKLSVGAARRSTLLAFGLTSLLLSGCQGAYFNTMEQFGVHKRDLMVLRVEGARDAQAEAAEQFDSALDQFQALLRDMQSAIKQADVFIASMRSN